MEATGGWGAGQRWEKPSIARAVGVGFHGNNMAPVVFVRDRSYPAGLGLRTSSRVENVYRAPATPSTDRWDPRGGQNDLILLVGSHNGALAGLSTSFLTPAPGTDPIVAVSRRTRAWLVGRHPRLTQLYTRGPSRHGVDMKAAAMTLVFNSTPAQRSPTRTLIAPGTEHGARPSRTAVPEVLSPR